MTSPKEPHFLAFNGQRVSFIGPGDDVTFNRVACTDLDRYLGLFRDAHRFGARGEGSVSTLYYPERSLATLERYFPDSKVIAILRDPVDRAFSSFQFLRARGFEACTAFEQALDLEEFRIRAGWHHLWHYAAMGRYGRQLEPFMRRLGPDRVKVVFFDDLVEKPADVLGEIFSFLGVSPRRTPSLDRANASGEPRNRTIHRAFTALERSGRARSVIAGIVPRRARDWVRGKSLSRVTPSESAIERLRATFRADTMALQGLIGETRAPGWAA